MQFSSGTTELNDYFNRTVISSIENYLDSLPKSEQEKMQIHNKGFKQCHTISLMHIIESASMVQIMVNSGAEINDVCSKEQILNYCFSKNKLPELLTFVTQRAQYQMQDLPDEIIFSLIKK